MTTLTEGMHTGEFIGESAMSTGYHTDTKTLISGQNLAAGRVVGKITASGKYTAYDNTAADGSEVADGIMFGPVDASGGDKNAVIVRRGPMTVNANDLGWGANDATGISAGKADLLLLGIKVV